MAYVRHGTRTIAGTDWPVYSMVRWDGIGYGARAKPWVATIALCNGIPSHARRFRAFREALAYVEG
jgi:hypothetical protein